MYVLSVIIIKTSFTVTVVLGRVNNNLLITKNPSMSVIIMTVIAILHTSTLFFIKFTNIIQGIIIRDCWLINIHLHTEKIFCN